MFALVATTFRCSETACMQYHDLKSNCLGHEQTTTVPQITTVQAVTPAKQPGYRFHPLLFSLQQARKRIWQLWHTINRYASKGRSAKHMLLGFNTARSDTSTHLLLFYIYEQNRNDRLRQPPAEMSPRICAWRSHQSAIRDFDKCRTIDRCLITRHMLNGKRSRYILSVSSTYGSSALQKAPEIANTRCTYRSRIQPTLPTLSIQRTLLHSSRRLDSATLPDTGDGSPTAWIPRLD
jgi:hypothetical protein